MAFYKLQSISYVCTCTYVSQEVTFSTNHYSKMIVLKTCFWLENQVFAVVGKQYMLLNVSFIYLGILILSALVSIKYFWGKQDLIFGNIDSNPKNLYPNALFTISNQKMIVIGYYHISIILIQKGSIIWGQNFEILNIVQEIHSSWLSIKPSCKWGSVSIAPTGNHLCFATPYS